MRFQTEIACTTGLFLATTLGACNRVAPGPASTPSPDNGGRIGDSTAYGVRIVGFNGPRDRATFTLSEPAYVVALAVIPGKTVELVARRPAGDTTFTSSGEHKAWIAVPRTGLRVPEPRLEDRLDYQQCVAQQHVNARTAQTVVIGRDSTGREMTQTVSGAPYSDEVQAECSRLVRRTKLRARPTEMPNPNRFLVLIASNTRLTAAELDERLSAMRVDAKDIQATIAGIAGALYPGNAVWSGYYKRW